MERAYVSASVKDELSVKRVRYSVWRAINKNSHYRTIEPHITIVPPFVMKEGHYRDVCDEVRRSELSGERLSVDSVSVYENLHKPYVVSLSLRGSMENKQDEMVDNLRQHARGPINDPADPHITLMKTKGGWDTVDRETKSRIQKAIINTPTPNSVEIGDVNVKLRR